VRIAVAVAVAKTVPQRPVNTRYLSTTDPDAAIVRRGKATLLYQAHRAVNGRSEGITATRVTAGDSMKPIG
jgi:hypothetical protein